MLGCGLLLTTGISGQSVLAPAAGTNLTPTVTMMSSPNPSKFGQAVTLTATVTSGATGKVTFYDGTTILGVSTLTSGQAMLSTGLQASGTRSLHAYYGGDSSFAANGSPPISQIITPVPAGGLQGSVNYGTGMGPYSAASGDFNGDGKLDVVVTNSGADSVGVLLGNGDGSFGTLANYGVGSTPIAIGVGDFNGDGKTDLAVANLNHNTVSVLLGNGDGTFQPAVSYGVGTNPVSLAVADFNGDGKADLAVANLTDNTVSILLGNGDATFQNAGTSAAGNSPISIGAGDFNGDGTADLAVANLIDGTVSVLLANGNGTFQPAVNYNVIGPTPIYPQFATVGDLDGNGTLDLVVAFGAGVAVLAGKGDGTFSQPGYNLAGASPSSVVMADFNGDGTTDLAVSDFDGNNASLLLFGGPFPDLLSYNTGTSPTSAVVGDFNGDGRPDLAVVNYGANAISVLVGSAPPSISCTPSSLNFTFTIGYQSPRTQTCAIAITGDGLNPTVTTAGPLFLGLSGQLNGQNLTVLTAVTPSPADVGTYTGSAKVWTQHGATLTVPVTITIRPQSAGGPSAVSVSPPSGSGLSQIFTAITSHPFGAQQIASIYFQVNSDPYDTTPTCYVDYDQASNQFYLQNDVVIGPLQPPGTPPVWLGPLAPGSSNSISNSQCTLHGTGSGATASGNNLSVNMSITFALAFAGARNTYLGATDVSSASSGFQQFGMWTVPSYGPPAVVSISPASGSGTLQSFAVTVSSSGGPTAINLVYLLINSSLSTAGACYIEFNHAANTFRLSNDAGSAWLGPITLGTVTSLANGQCTISATGASISTSATNLTVNFPVSFAYAFRGAKSTFGLAEDNSAQFSPWKTTGTWAVPAPGTLVYIDSPAASSTVTGITTVAGWAIVAAGDSPITSVPVTVDGVPVGNATYGISRPDVCSVYQGRPGCPNVGYSFSLNTAGLTPGPHRITVLATNNDVTHTGYASVTVNVGIQPPTVWIDGPANGSTVSGTIVVSGWALDNNAMVGTMIGSVKVKVDSAAPVTAAYGVSRPDVCGALPGRSGCPNVGYSLAINTLALSAGQHTITVTAVDSDGYTDVGSATVTVRVNNVAPTVWIDAPAANSTVSGTVTVSGWAIDNASIVGTALGSVQVLVDGLVVGNATYGTSRPDVCSALPGRPGCPNVGYTFALNTAGWSAGPHVITVSTTDSDGTGEVGLASVTVTTAANATAPTVWIDQPAAGATVSGAVIISGWALDNASAVGSAISNVQVLVDGLPVGNAMYGTNRADVCSALPGRPGCPNVGYTFTLNSGTLTLGSHTITVKAIDSDPTPDAAVASATVTINTAPATIWIDQPLPGAVSGTVTISGWAINNASGLGTAISGVQVLLDGAVVGGATYGTSRPDVCGVLPGRPNCPNVGYTFALNTGNLSPGQHVITVTAVDSDKVPQSGSASVTVTVNNGPPTVWIDQPVAGATISGTVTVSGWAVDNGTVVGTAIGSVQVNVDGTVIGTAAYGSSRADVCAVYVGRPGCPNVGYSFPWNTSGLSAGVHILTVTATDGNGNADVGNASVVVIK
jgi:hypothetical protein